MGRYIPYVIISAFIAFGIFVGSFIWKASQSEVNLVSKDYYQKELEYQDRIDVLERSAVFSDSVHVVVENGVVGVVIPEILVGAKGDLHFYRPSNHQIDELVAYLPTKTLTKLNMVHLKKGFWVLKISLATDQGVSYFFERNLTI